MNAAPRDYKVHSEMVEVRIGPGAEYPITAKLPKGEVVTSSSLEGEEWVKITISSFQNGSLRISKGYVNRQGLTKL
ncbi:SH3 domain-containing protein [Nibribacter ruber]|uniref:SH3 domain-containing protein n=1 Tax=Nibribacter ruber TaxID=2698458 RepID=A0A6P1P1N1_9BACT|nr:SH3 domain-containing protein [Nibribacter ruber]QHL87943.1 SH3 domain-containing protein [Nibribacter ruber]